MCEYCDENRKRYRARYSHAFIDNYPYPYGADLHHFILVVDESTDGEHDEHAEIAITHCPWCGTKLGKE